jgi:prepilin-type processing-associated H-X9-DG protein
MPQPVRLLDSRGRWNYNRGEVVSLQDAGAMRTRAWSARGATVLEHTVVICIIGVLLSILMPTLGMVRENALATQCQQHLRSLALAVQHYMADYHSENWLPASELPRGPWWFQKLEPFVGGHARGRSRENFVCPRAHPSQRGFGRDSISYGWNEAYLPFGTLSNKVTNPDETVIIGDSLPGPRSDTLLEPSGEPRLATRHRDRGNVLFLGGNVGAMTQREALFQWPRYWDRD